MILFKKISPTEAIIYKIRPISKNVMKIFGYVNFMYSFKNNTGFALKINKK